MLKVVEPETEVIKLFNTILLVLSISMDLLVKILENFTELAETAKVDIKEKELFIWLMLLLKMLTLLLDTTVTMEILLPLKIQNLLHVDMFAELSKEEMMEKNLLLLDIHVIVPLLVLALANKQVI